MLTYDTEAIARLASRLGDALHEFANEVRAEVAHVPGDEDGAATAGMGPRQLQVFELLMAAPDDGMKTGELAEIMRYDAPNAYLTLKSLVNRGLVEMVPGSSPQRWRALRQRGSSAPYLAAAQVIRPGEWATYGDISIAIRGDDRAARAVGRAAATLPDFPNAQRVLQAGGVIPDGWHDGAGRGPEECRRRLEEEGVHFTGGRADPAGRVSWEELRQRLLDAGVNVPPLAAT